MRISLFAKGGIPFFPGLLFTFCFSSFLPFGQAVAQNNLVMSIDNTVGFDEPSLREKMKNDGLSPAVIDKLIEQRKELFLKGKNVQWTSLKKSNPVTNALCSDMGVESGWNSWLGDLGTANSGFPPTWTPPAALPTAPNFTITTGSGIDPNTPGPNAGDPKIPVVCPGYGKNSIKIGETCVAGCVAEQLTFPLAVTANDTNFTYSYAIVIEDAGHAVADQPFVDLCIYDQSGNPVPCGCFRYTAGPSIPGFFNISNSGCGFAGADQYKPWTFVGVNLANYIGQTVNVVITNVDCAQCGHWAYSYWDFSCGKSIYEYCIGTQNINICAPSDPAISFIYQWYQNGSIMPGSTNQCIIVNNPLPTDIYSVFVQQPSGCNFYMNYTLQPTGASAAFSAAQDTAIPLQINFTDMSTGSPAVSWYWTFGDGDTSALQNPSHTYSVGGTYTACLVVTDSAGCMDSTCITFNTTTLGMIEQSISLLSVYPNPAQNELVFDFGMQSAGNTEIIFSTPLGIEIRRMIMEGSGKHHMDVSEFSKGIYFLKLQTDSGIETKKIVIAK